MVNIKDYQRLYGFSYFSSSPHKMCLLQYCLFFLVLCLCLMKHIKNNKIWWNEQPNCLYHFSALFCNCAQSICAFSVDNFFQNIAPLLIRLYMSYIMRYKEDIVYQTFHVSLPYLIFLMYSNSNILDQNLNDCKSYQPNHLWLSKQNWY